MAYSNSFNKNDLTLVVLAAGIGSRYGGLKQVDPIGPSGEMIIDYSVYDALRSGFTKIVFVISRAIEEVFREKVGRTIEQHCETEYVYQQLDDLPAGFSVPPGRIKPWGTAHATLSSRDAVHSPFAVINADDFYGRGAFQAIADFMNSGTLPEDPAGKMNFCMVGYRLENTLTEHGHVARGICSMDEQGYLVSVQERTHIEKDGESARYTEDGDNWFQIPVDSVVSMNTWGFWPTLYPELAERFAGFLTANRDNELKAEYFLPSVISDLVAEGKASVKVLNTNERWYGMTYAQDRPMVKKAIEEMVRQGLYPQSLWKQGIE